MSAEERLRLDAVTAEFSTKLDNERQALKKVLRRLEARVPDLTLSRAGGAYPFTADGMLHGLVLYFRYRSGHASIRLLDSTEDIFAPLYEAEEDFGDSYQGDLSSNEFEQLFLRLVPQLQRAPRLWEFMGVATVATPRGPVVGEPDTCGAWGQTPEEAWDQMHQYPAENVLLARYFTPQSWAEHLAERRMNPQTITVDERVWPDPEPTFTVLPAPEA